MGLISRPVFYRLVELAIEVDVTVEADGKPESQLGVWSSGQFFKFG